MKYPLKTRSSRRERRRNEDGIVWSGRHVSVILAAVGAGLKDCLGQEARLRPTRQRNLTIPPKQTNQETNKQIDD